MKTSRKNPPKIASWILERLVDETVRYSAMGDFEERFDRNYSQRGFIAAWILCWSQIMVTIPTFLIYKVFWRVIMFRNYLKIAFRNMTRHKGYSLIIIIGLAVGLTCGILILLFIEHELSYDRFHDKADQLYRIADSQKLTSEERSVATTNGELYNKVIPKIPEIDHSARFIQFNQTITIGNNKFNEKVCFANPGFFDVFSFELLKGDKTSFLKHPNELAISEHLADKWFRNKNPLGSVLIIGGSNSQKEFIISGILKNVPASSHLQFKVLASYLAFEDIIFNKMYTYVALTKNAIRDDVENKINNLAQQYMKDELKIQHNYFLQPIKSIYLHSHLSGELGKNRKIVYIYAILTAAFAVILIACINFINLTTARSRLRAKEVGLRKVIGASKGQLVEQFIGEIIICFSIASIIAIFLAIQILPVFNSLVQSNLSLTAHNVSRIILYGFLLMVVVGLIASIYPAFLMSAFSPGAVLKQRYDKISFSSLVVRKGLVIFQFSISIIFICGMLFVFKQMNYIRGKDLGFQRENIICIPAYKKTELLRIELLNHPNIGDVTFSRFIQQGNYAGPPLTWEPKDAQSEKLSLKMASVAYNFFEFFHIEILEGRIISQNLSTDAQNAVLLNEAAVEQIGWENPLGKQIKYSYNNTNYTVIGIVKNYHNVSLYEGIQPTIFKLDESGDQLYIRIQPHQTEETIAYIKEKVKEIQDEYLFRYYFLNDRIKYVYKDENILFQIFQFGTILTCIIATMGLLGLVIFSVENRVKEIAIRKILGASVNRVVKLLTGEFINLILISNILAWPIIYLIMRAWLDHFYYRINITIWPFLFSAILAFIIAISSVVSLTYKAAQRNPADSMRNE